ncbi:translation protein SH3-like domain-containing protein [Coniella lustricola]|uniref:Large ribosomal subunit protein uL2m n=1 Tax=Coniella lustricola TaxID=2025994 RepID=A0A2T2ZW71_9PEZI|nr:translation protein SH3-like domain-containing protein [Coniella lustricola]
MLQPRIRPLATAMRALLAAQPRIAVAATYATSAAPKKSKDKLRQATPFAQTVTLAESEDSAASVTLRTYKPRTPGLRHLKRPINDHLWRGRPYRPLTFPKKGQARGGRNNTGRITVRHRGGGAKRRIRTVDFDRKEPGPHVVDRVEYDPGRTAHIALVTNRATGRKSYIIAADGMRAGDIVHSYRAGLPKDLLEDMGGVIDPGILAARTAHRGNCLPMHLIPVGTMIYCIGSRKDGPAKFCRSAGTYGMLEAKDEEMRDDGSKAVTGKHVTVRLQSGELRKVDKDAIATIGIASNVHYSYTSLGKAGRNRWLGIRPTVRGLAMNSVDHPHGGGRGKSKGNRIPVSPWGKPAKSGYKTRRTNNINRHVVTPRVRNHGKRKDRKSGS